MKEQRSALVTQYKGLIAEAQKLSDQYVGKEMPPEASKQIDGFLGQADQVKVQIDNVDRITKGQEYLEQSQGSAALHHGWRASSPAEGDVVVDQKAWRELEVKTPTGEVKVRFNVPLAVQAKGYAAAFEEYARKGYSMMRPEGQKTLLLGNDSAGGFLVPEDYQTQLIRKVATMTVFRQYARVITTSRDSVKWPRIKYTTDDNYTSGVRQTWTGESPASSTAHRVTDPVFGLIDIPVHTSMASMPLSNDLLEDSAFDVAGISAELLGEAFGLGEENVFWNGTGAGQPLGITTNIAATDGVTAVNSGSAASLTADGLIDLIYALPAQYEPGARIFWRKATEKIVRQIKINGTDTEYVWPTEERVGAFGVADPTILGFPISRAEFVPDVDTNTYPIMFGQLTGYMVVDRVGLSLQRLDQVYAEQNVIVLLARKRVGGQVVEPWRLRAQKCST